MGPLSAKFVQFLEDYAKTTGKDAAVIIEEAVSQAIMRHQADDPHPAHDALLMPGRDQRELLALFEEFDRATVADAAFGEFMERLPDRPWTYQSGRHGEWWFLVVSLTPQALPPPLELRSLEVSQAYAWLFGYTKRVRFWSAPDRFLLAF